MYKKNTIKPGIKVITDGRLHDIDGSPSPRSPKSFNSSYSIEENLYGTYINALFNDDHDEPRVLNVNRLKDFSEDNNYTGYVVMTPQKFPKKLNFENPPDGISGYMIMTPQKLQKSLESEWKFPQKTTGVLIPKANISRTNNLNDSTGTPNYTIMNPVKIKKNIEDDYKVRQRKADLGDKLSHHSSISSTTASTNYAELYPSSHENSSGITTSLLSCIYGVFLVVFGTIIYVSDLNNQDKIISEIFSAVIAILGLLWLIFFHFSLYRYKKKILADMKHTLQEDSDRFSNTTEYIFNSFIKNNHEASYRFLQGRHSGSFYLKVGMAAFCFGNLIYGGLQLGHDIMSMKDMDKAPICFRISTLIAHIIMPIYAFYQLFMTFKYSNVIINQYKGFAKFGLMHIISSCLCVWFHTILQEAVEDYQHRITTNSNISVTHLNIDIGGLLISADNSSHWHLCKENSALSMKSISAIPYLYPFAIEYNLLLAGVWFIMWQNIGSDCSLSDPHPLHQKRIDSENYTYQSNLVISADCHAANKGLFAGLLLLLATIVTVIVFFVSMTTNGEHRRAVQIHNMQEIVLTVLPIICLIVAFRQTSKLNINPHSVTFLDEVLIFIPLPFYFIHGILSIIANYVYSEYVRLFVDILFLVKIVIQTPFIIDGLRRCSNTASLRYKKPGREIITFLIICNLTMWIVNTFQLRSVDIFHAQPRYYGELVWMLVEHVTVPPILFYKFHASVCLADFWKSAYDKAEC